MFSLFKKKDTSIIHGDFPITTDIHSHILPGIDDGSPDPETSLVLIRGLYELGIRKCIATPHIIGDLYRNTPASVHAALETTKQVCVSAGIEMELSAAAEYMLDDHFMTLLRNGEPLLTLHDNFILTEVSYASEPENLGEMAFHIITGGYRPVLAHPERYHYFLQNFRNYSRLKELGFHLQVNLLSLTGYYGKPTAKAAKFILDEGLSGMVGTDLHHERHLAALRSPANREVFERYLRGGSFNEFVSRE